MKVLVRILGVLPLALLVGCASGYHCYPCGKVSCNYCPPNPMPYSCNESCNCQDSLGQRYLANLPEVAEVKMAPQTLEKPVESDD